MREERRLGATFMDSIAIAPRGNAVPSKQKVLLLSVTPFVRSSFHISIIKKNLLIFSQH